MDKGARNKIIVYGTIILIAVFGIFSGCHKSHVSTDTASAIAQPDMSVQAVPTDMNARDSGDTASVVAEPSTDAVKSEDPAPLSVSVHFDFDSADIRAGDLEILNIVAESRNATAFKIRISGNADERGATEYNYVLGLRRAISVKNYLVSQGVPVGSISVISYGEEKPVCVPLPNAVEKGGCYQANRRVDVEVGQQ